MPIPKVAIVGRPNVGKSSIFNWLVGERIAIVDSVAGVTRDRMTHPVEIGDRLVELIDTGGMGIEDIDNLTEDVEAQIQLAIDTADVILFVLDTRTGWAPLDDKVARRLRGIETPVVCVANKTDNDSFASQADEFYRFGFDMIRTSAKQKRGRHDLINAIIERLPDETAAEDDHKRAVMKVALVGRRNVGKSTFINTLIDEPRMIVSNVPGTTRDSVDIHFELDGLPFVAIDTPGYRRAKSVSSNIDFYGTRRANRSIRRADVVLMFFDAAQRIGKVDKQLVNYVADQNKPCIFVVNKWDLMAEHEMPTSRWADYLRDTFANMWHVPVAFVTGKTGRNIKMLLNHAQMLFRQSYERVPTSTLNKLLKLAVEHTPPPLHYHRRPKIYYAVQADVAPPTIVIFCNMPDGFTPTYRRYLLSVLRDELDFGEVPIKVYYRKRGEDDTTDEIDGKIKRD